MINCPDANANPLAQLTNSHMSRLVYVLSDAHKLDKKLNLLLKVFMYGNFS